MCKYESTTSFIWRSSRTHQILGPRLGRYHALPRFQFNLAFLCELTNSKRNDNGSGGDWQQWRTISNGARSVNILFKEDCTGPGKVIHCIPGPRPVLTEPPMHKKQRSK